MDGNKKMPLRLVLCALAAVTPFIAGAAELMNAREVLRHIEIAPGTNEGSQSSTAARLLEEIVRFRVQSANMTPRQAATAWFDLYERADSPGRDEWRSDKRAYDIETYATVGPHTVLAALPPPNAWAALNTEARTQARKAPRDPKILALRLMTELLVQDRRASTATLKEIQALADRLPPEERDRMRTNVAAMRWTLAELYGTPDEVAAAFAERVDARGSTAADEPLKVPDLVATVGEQRAAELLQAALTRPVRLDVKEGEATQALARRIAREQVDTLREPQWSLVDRVEATELYEALQKRFHAQALQPASPGRFDDGRARADVWYFLGLVIASRQEEAEKMLATLASNEPLTLPPSAMEALQQAGHNEALYGFLHAVLTRRPELQAWNVYMEQAAFTAHSADALKLITSLLKRRDLPDYVLVELRYHRANALLAEDQVDSALPAFRQLLAQPPRRDEKTLQTRVNAAVRLAAVGRILNRRDIAAAGIAFARQVLELPGDDELRAFQREALMRSVFAEQRKLGLSDQAQMLAVAEIRRRASIVDEYQEYGLAPLPQTAAMAELAGIYVSQKRFQDAATLLDESTKWGARDLAALLHIKDSQDVPLGLIAARTLAAGGNIEAALSVTRAVVEAHPGNDASYELLLEIDANAASYFDELYAQDAFEERPLIWKALALHRARQFDEAQKTIERAIAVDPSDGEQGPNDRMRAHLVLADILDAKGDRKTAAEHRNTLDAIRISEGADELYRHGLYKRAFARYREALDHFAAAYCIRSRFAVQLNQQGQSKEALEHYRRAYELMPASFGRMESHCFGCETVFQGAAQQGLAAQVFQEILARNSQQPQANYLLGYLREAQGRHADALQLYRQAVSLDSEYLSAWKRLHDLGDRLHIDPKERDIARLKLMTLDPRQRHVTYQLSTVTDLAAMWRATVAAQAAFKPKSAGTGLYTLRRSAQVQDESLARLPAPKRDELQMRQSASVLEFNRSLLLTPQQAMVRHEIIKAAARLMGAEPNRVQH